MIRSPDLQEYFATNGDCPLNSFERLKNSEKLFCQMISSISPIEKDPDNVNKCH